MEGDREICPNCEQLLVQDEFGMVKCPCGYESKFMVIPLKEIHRVMNNHFSRIDFLFGNQYDEKMTVFIKSYQWLIAEINTNRKAEGKTAIENNNYIICNEDEPYAQKVIETILEGSHRVKNAQSSSNGTELI